MKKIIFIILVLGLLNGCATITGPYVSEEEIFQAQEELEVKALGYKLRQLERVNNIGFRLIANLPLEDLRTNKVSSPYFGIYVFNIDKYFKSLFNLSQNRGCVVGVVARDSPAEKAGVRVGDLLISIDDTKIEDTADFYKLSRRFNVGQIIKLKVLRQNKTEIVPVTVGSITLNIRITMVDWEEVNAAATSDRIFVTYGLIQFTKSDDEIAAVLGHELAHIVRGHIAKAQGASLLSLLLTLPLGIIAESRAPGSGDLVMHVADIFKASYSRDLEREADYFGTKFVYLAGFDVDVCANFMERFAIEIPHSLVRNYLSTHPSSPERMLRIKKTINELKSQEPKPLS